MPPIYTTSQDGVILTDCHFVWNIGWAKFILILMVMHTQAARKEQMESVLVRVIPSCTSPHAVSLNNKCKLDQACVVSRRRRHRRQHHWRPSRNRNRHCRCRCQLQSLSMLSPNVVVDVIASCCLLLSSMLSPVVFVIVVARHHCWCCRPLLPVVVVDVVARCHRRCHRTSSSSMSLPIVPPPSLSTSLPVTPLPLSSSSIIIYSTMCY